MIRTQPAWLVLGVCLTVAGCGGGGTAASSSGSGTTTPVQPTIKLDTVGYSAVCNGKTHTLAGVKVVLHKADGSMHSQWTTDNNGHFELQKPADVSHISVVYKNGQSQYHIQSYISPAYLDLGVLRLADERFSEFCSCKTVSVNWSDIRRAQPEFKLVLSSPLQAAQTNLTGSVTRNYCADNSGRFGKVQLMLAPANTGPSYVSEIDMDSQANNSTLELRLADMTAAGRVIGWSANMAIATLTSDNVQAGTRHFVFNASGSDTDLLRVFDRDGMRQRVLAVSTNQALSPSSTGTIGYQSSRQQPLSGNSITLNLPSNQRALADSFSSLLPTWMSSRSGSYNFSSFAGVNQALLTAQSNQLRWIYITAPQASLVDLQLPQAELTALAGERITYVRLELQGQGSGLSYADYQKAQAEFSRGTKVDNDGSFDTTQRELIDWTTF